MEINSNIKEFGIYEVGTKKCRFNEIPEKEFDCVIDVELVPEKIEVSKVSA